MTMTEAVSASFRPSRSPILGKHGGGQDRPRLSSDARLSGVVGAPPLYVGTGGLSRRREPSALYTVPGPRTIQPIAALTATGAPPAAMKTSVGIGLSRRRGGPE